MSQAPGLSGTPDSGHCASGATRASCASSSATPTLRTIRARPAMSLADSIRQTASIARCVSVAVTPTDHIIFQSPSASRGTATAALSLRRLLDLRAQALLLLSEFGSELRTKIGGFEHLTNFNFGFNPSWIRAALEPLDRLFHGPHLP